MKKILLPFAFFLSLLACNRTEVLTLEEAGIKEWPSLAPVTAIEMMPKDSVNFYVGDNHGCISVFNVYTGFSERIQIFEAGELIYQVHAYASQDSDSLDRLLVAARNAGIREVTVRKMVIDRYRVPLSCKIELNEQKSRTYTLPDKGIRYSTYSVADDRHGGFIAATSNGIFRFDPDDTTSTGQYVYNSSHEHTAPCRFFSIVEKVEGNKEEWYVAGEKGLVRLSWDSNSGKLVATLIDNTPILDIARDTNDAIMALAADGRLMSCEPDGLKETEFRFDNYPIKYLKMGDARIGFSISDMEIICDDKRVRINAGSEPGLLPSNDRLRHFAIAPDKANQILANLLYFAFPSRSSMAQLPIGLTTPVEHGQNIASSCFDNADNLFCLSDQNDLYYLERRVSGWSEPRFMKRLDIDGRYRLAGVIPDNRIVIVGTNEVYTTSTDWGGAISHCELGRTDEIHAYHLDGSKIILLYVNEIRSYDFDSKESESLFKESDFYPIAIVKAYSDYIVAGLNTGIYVFRDGLFDRYEHYDAGNEWMWVTDDDGFHRYRALSDRRKALRALLVFNTDLEDIKSKALMLVSQETASFRMLWSDDYVYSSDIIYDFDTDEVSGNYPLFSTSNKYLVFNNCLYWIVNNFNRSRGYYRETFSDPVDYKSSLGSYSFNDMTVSPYETAMAMCVNEGVFVFDKNHRQAFEEDPKAFFHVVEAPSGFSRLIATSYPWVLIGLLVAGVLGILLLIFAGMGIKRLVQQIRLKLAEAAELEEEREAMRQEAKTRLAGYQDYRAVKELMDNPRALKSDSVTETLQMLNSVPAVNICSDSLREVAKPILELDASLRQASLKELPSAVGILSEGRQKFDTDQEVAYTLQDILNGWGRDKDWYDDSYLGALKNSLLYVSRNSNLLRLKMIDRFISSEKAVAQLGLIGQEVDSLLGTDMKKYAEKDKKEDREEFGSYCTVFYEALDAEEKSTLDALMAKGTARGGEYTGNNLIERVFLLLPISTPDPVGTMLFDNSAYAQRKSELLKEVSSPEDRYRLRHITRLVPDMECPGLVALIALAAIHAKDKKGGKKKAVSE